MNKTTENEFELSDHPFKYIHHATFKDAWMELKPFLLPGGVLCVVFGILVIIYKLFGVKDEYTSWLPQFSAWTWIAIAYVAGSWFGRGKTIHFRIPNLKWPSWTIFYGSFAIIYWLAERLSWVGGILFCAYTFFIFILENLNRIGYQNVQLSHAMKNDSFLNLIESCGWTKSTNGMWFDCESKPIERENFIAMLEEYIDTEFE